jgi:hypothetical protein
MPRTYLQLCIEVFSNVESWGYFMQWVHNSFKECTILSISVSILYILIDSDTCLATLTWKTDNSKTVFCFTVYFTLQCELFTGRNCKGSLPTLSFSHWYYCLCWPNPANLTPCGIKEPHTEILKNKHSYHVALLHDTCPEILTVGSNGEGKITY